MLNVILAYEGTFFLSSEPQSSRTCVRSTLGSAQHSSVPWGVSLRSAVTQIFSCNDIASILSGKETRYKLIDMVMWL